MGALVELLIIGVLILVTGVFVAAEIALVTVRRSRLQQLIDEGDKRARRVDRLISQPGRFLAVLQLVITFVGFLAAAFAGQSIAQALADGITPFLGASAAGGVAIVVVTLGVAVVTAVFGELIPKTLALAHAERYSLVLARPVEIVGRILAPVVSILDGITGGSLADWVSPPSTGTGSPPKS